MVVEAPRNQDSSRMGKAVEHLVAAKCILSSRGKLNVSTALVDDEGVDLVFHKRDGTATLAIQVKARMSDAATFGRGRFIHDLRVQAFKARRDLFALFVPLNVKSANYDYVWLIPSLELIEKVKANPRGRYRFNASLASKSKDQWIPYRIEAAELPLKLLEILDSLE
jgi:hypothetical protein